MTVFTIVVSVVTAAGTLAVVLLAWKPWKASPAMEKAATQSASYDRQIAEITAAARDADERFRQRQQLQEVGKLAKMIRMAAMDATRRGHSDSPTWKCGDQDLLQIALVGAELPKCRMLVWARNPGTVVAAAMAAEMEVAAAVRQEEVRWAAVRHGTASA